MSTPRDAGCPSDPDPFGAAPTFQQALTAAGGSASDLYSIDLTTGAAETLEPSVASSGKVVAFNIMTLSQLIGTPLQPDLAGHVLMLEEVSEYMYRIDRSLFHVPGNPACLCCELTDVR